MRKIGAQVVIISCGSRESSVVGIEFLATVSSVTSNSHIALAHVKWRDAVENPLTFSRVCAIVIDEAHCVSKW